MNTPINSYPPQKAKFFVGILFHEGETSKEEIISFFNNQGFSACLESEPTFYEMANYYSKEMGPANKLKRFWLTFKGVEDRTKLLELKARSCDWEEYWQKEKKAGGRVVNIDPGFISHEQVVLSTCKPYSHRLYLGAVRHFHIYGELTYVFQHKNWHSLDWTYPDYQIKEVKEFFLSARESLIDDLKEL